MYIFTVSVTYFYSVCLLAEVLEHKPQLEIRKKLDILRQKALQLFSGRHSVYPEFEKFCSHTATALLLLHFMDTNFDGPQGGRYNESRL